MCPIILRSLLLCVPQAGIQQTLHVTSIAMLHTPLRLSPLSRATNPATIGPGCNRCNTCWPRWPQKLEVYAANTHSISLKFEMMEKYNKKWMNTTNMLVGKHIDWAWGTWWWRRWLAWRKWWWNNGHKIAINHWLYDPCPMLSYLCSRYSHKPGATCRSPPHLSGHGNQNRRRVCETSIGWSGRRSY